jgi:hypothetical protein
MFTQVDRIAWDDVRELWPIIAVLLEHCEFIAAHNASFDSGVLSACAEGGIRSSGVASAARFSLARKMWDLRPTRHCATPTLGLCLHRDRRRSCRRDSTRISRSKRHALHESCAG